jgi:hypothetical protein
MSSFTITGSLEREGSKISISSHLVEAELELPHLD